MHWNVPPDAIPGSATLVRVLDRWLNDWDYELRCVVEKVYLWHLFIVTAYVQVQDGHVG